MVVFMLHEPLDLFLRLEIVACTMGMRHIEQIHDFSYDHACRVFPDKDVLRAIISEFSFYDKLEILPIGFTYFLTSSKALV